MPITLIPLVGGIQGQIDHRLLPDGALKTATNVEQDREGRLIGRASYTAVATTTYGTGAHVAYDLFAFNDRLLALGDAQSKGFPTDVFEYLPSGAARWRPSSAAGATC